MPAAAGLTSATVHMTVHVNPDRLADLSNTSTVSSTPTDPTPPDHAATETTPAETSTLPLHDALPISDPVLAGNNLTYTVTVTNSGPSFARNVSISDPVPAGTSFVIGSEHG